MTQNEVHVATSSALRAVRREVITWIAAAFIYANVLLGLFVFGSNSGHLYGTSTAHARQTAALLNGRFAIGESPYDLQFDNAYVYGRIQQVWGLGVPLWMLPFEAAGRLTGMSPFPDRVAMWLALLLFGLYAMSIVTVPHGPSMSAKLCVTILVVCAPPLWILVGMGPQRVYEDVSVYTFIASGGLLAAVLRLAWGGGWRDFWIASAFAAWLVLIRPTFLTYSVAGTAVAAFICYGRERAWRHLAGAAALLVASVLVIVWSNVVRFGSPGEFGHRLTVSPADNVMTSRFVNPISTVSAFDAGRELFCATFFTFGNLRNKNDFGEGVFPYQANVFRWRCWDYSTFDPFVLILAVAGVAASLGRIARTGLVRTLFQVRGEAVTSLVMLVWTIPTFCALFLFLMRYPGLWSRYVYDFWPALSGALIAFFLTLVRRFPRAAWLLLIAFFGVEWHRADSRIGRAPGYTPELQPTHRVLQTSGVYDAEHLPDWRLEDNGVVAGWDRHSGAASYVVMVPVDRPATVELLVSPPSVSAVRTKADRYQAVLGGKPLELQAVEPTADTDVSRVTFKVPPTFSKSASTELLFLCFVAVGDQADRDSVRILRSIRWR